jgi:hypothetical protein
MAVQGSGEISITDIADVFGGVTPHSLSEYLGQGGTIPSSGEISFSDFYGQDIAYTRTYNVIDASDTCAYGAGIVSAGGLRVQGWGNIGPYYRGTENFTEGKLYYEVYTPVSYPDGMNMSVGWSSATASICSVSPVFHTYGYSGFMNNSLSFGGSGGFGSLVAGDIVMVAMDIDNGKIWFGKNGSWYTGNPSTGTSPAFTFTPSGSYSPFTTFYDAYGSRPDNQYNFGQNGTFNGYVTAGNNTDVNGLGDFKYTVPTGFTGTYTSVRTYAEPN